jgi:hypothetical protein
MSLFSSLLTPPIRRLCSRVWPSECSRLCPGWWLRRWRRLRRFPDDPAVIDQAWQKASAKYDAERGTILEEVDRVGHQGRFRPDWESLAKYEVPEWYEDAKFGIFIHWGFISVPAFGNEWYPRNMYREGSEEYKHHIATYGPQDQFGYKDFIPLFQAQHFDPAAWARCSRKRAPNTWFPSLNITTASP